MDNTKNNNSYKVSELVLSFALLIAAGISFSLSAPHLYGAAENISTISGINMRGGQARQHIEIGVPYVWLKNITEKLKEKGSKVFISRKNESTWLINASISNNLSELEKKKLKIFLERYGIDLNHADEINVKLTSF